ncbi:MAG: DUF2752 domain-containing protein [Planctomycetales bacterium]|nr:DUF2752 domain-containing protein [Planctomycetales bacterium]
MQDGSIKRIATTVGVSLFAFYLAWNAWWLSMLQIPPSIFWASTGLPSPTTGGTRSFLALLDGNISLSLRHNPATIPILATLFVTLWFVVRRGSAPDWIRQIWVYLLFAAFVMKLVMN